MLSLDVGTRSVRGALVNMTNGSLLLGQYIATCPITVYEYSHQQQVYLEQSSSNIWSAIQQVCQELIQKCDSLHEEQIQIEAIALDATCSLVVYNVVTHLPVSISFAHSDANIILWACHRAEKEANMINQTKHKSLKYVGGKVSPEMQLPKLKWIQNHFPEIWNNPQNYFFDLADFLVYKLMEDETISLTTRRSICTTTCKWNFLSHEKQGWQIDLFQQLGMAQLLNSKEWNQRIGLNEEVTMVGEKVGTLSNKAAKELHLFQRNQIFSISIGMSMIDAHAGALGMLGTRNGEEIPLEQKLVIICGTSNCHIALQKKEIMVNGIWGPYCNIMLPNFWTLEGGQSSVGSLLDTIVQSHPYVLHQWKELTINDIHAKLNQYILQEKHQFPFDATREIHVLPYFNGNRSPLSDSNVKGSIVGLTQHNTLYNLALLYLATVQSLCYETIHIVEQVNQFRSKQQPPITSILLCGGLLKNSIFVQELASICAVLLGPNVTLRQVDEEIKGKTDAMLVGSAMLAAKACGYYSSVEEATNQMSVSTVLVKRPETEDEEARNEFHKRKYAVYKLLYIHQKQYQQIMHQ